MIFLGERTPGRMRMEVMAFLRVPVLIGLGMCFEGLAKLGPLILSSI